MPYIPKRHRPRLQEGNPPRNAGELNYCITFLCLAYIRNKGKSYQTLCEVEGVLNGASKEIYRRFTAPYEDEKIAENGDVEYAESLTR